MGVHTTRDFSSRLLACGRTRVAPDDAGFREPQRTVPLRLLSFPRSVYGVRVGRGALTALHPGQVVLAKPSAEYRRVLLEPAGERSDWLWVEPALLEELFGPLAPHWRAGGWHRPLSPADEWRQRRLAYSAERADPLEFEVEALALLRSVAASFGAPPVCRLPANAAQRDVAGHVITLLAERLESPPSLAELADAVGRSPAHLCVLFRSVTGLTLSAFRTRLRLSRALDRLRERHVELLPLALELGFAGHSHFSARFRRAFGLTPSAARALLARS